MIRVLFVCTVPTEKSGIPNVIFNLLSAMDQSGMDIGYVSINDPEESYKQQLKAMGVKLYVIPREFRHPFRYVRNLRKVLQNYDIVHVHGNSATMVLEMIAAKAAGVHLRIAHSHNTTCKQKKIDKIARPLFYKLCNGRIACGIEAGQWLFEERSFWVMNNGINADAFQFSSKVRQEVRSRLGNVDKFTIGHVGNFNKQKNHIFLVDVFSEYHKINPRSVMLLLGDGPLKDEMVRKAESLGLSDDIYFLGSIDHPEEYLNAMDLVVMPSIFEGFPLTLIEEQSNGLNILASDVITTTSNLTGLVKFKSLNDSATEWAKEIQDLSIQIERNLLISNDAIRKIKDSGYDIKTVAADLKSYYFQRLSK